MIIAQILFRQIAGEGTIPRPRRAASRMTRPSLTWMRECTSTLMDPLGLSNSQLPRNRRVDRHSWLTSSFGCRGGVLLRRYSGEQQVTSS